MQIARYYHHWSAGGLAAGLVMCACAAQAQDEAEPSVIVDVTGYYLMSDYGGDAAFGAIEGTLVGNPTDAFSISQRLTDPEGGGVRVSARRQFGSAWFAGAEYTGFFTDESAALGSAATDTDRVQANLLDRSLVSQLGLNGLLDTGGIVDSASETIDLEQHFGDLVVGQRIDVGGPLSGFWNAGLRVANTDLERGVFYQNLEGASDLDTARIDFRSEMWGVGPTFGGGVSLALPHGFALTTSASASALYADFDLSRRDVYFDLSDNETGVRQISLDTQEIVPVFDASVEVKKRIGRFHASLGYTMSAWLGGARTLITNGWDDTDNDSASYTVKSDNFVTHGVFARGGILLGDLPGDEATPLFAGGPANTTVDITGYYLMSDYGGDAAFGAIEGILLGSGRDAFSISQRLTDPEGGGVRVSARQFGSTWFAGAEYTGFFTDESAALGSAATDTDRVHANLLDRSLSDVLGLNGRFDDAIVDSASETIDLEQHFGDLVVGQRIDGGGPLSGFWNAGLRVANTDLQRGVFYQNLEGASDLDTARIDFRSEMWGVGPTFGGGVSLALPHGFALTTSASASALYADFDLSRRDVYFDQSANETGVRQISLDTQEIVPVFDASVEVKKRIGRFHASLGYTMSAWLGGARTLITHGWDDTDNDSASYTVKSDNFVTHGVFARGGILLGDLPGDETTPLFAGGPANTTVDITGYYLMSDYGGDAAFGAVEGTLVGNPTDAFSISQRLTDPEGGGVRVSARRQFGSAWFAGAEYTGFFTDESAALGSAATDTDRVHANLLDRSLVSQTGLNGLFDDAIVDSASETIDLEQHFGDLVVGQRIDGGGPLSGFWNAGLRVANTDLERGVFYQNLEGASDLDTARIDFRSEMWGVGPTLGGGVSLALPHGFALATSASASALYADFDLSRRDAYFDLSANETGVRQISLDTQEIVPVFDASVEVKKRIGRFHASLGYTMSAWLGGAQTMRNSGFDDVNDATASYTVKSDNVITHGLSARVGWTFGNID